MASWVKKVDGTGSYKFPTEEIMDAQNVNFAHKFPQNEEFLAASFVFLEESGPRSKFSDNRLNLEGNWLLMRALLSRRQ